MVYSVHLLLQLPILKQNLQSILIKEDLAYQDYSNSKSIDSSLSELLSAEIEQWEGRKRRKKEGAI